MANSIWTWLKKYWLYIVLGLLLVLYVITRILPGGRDEEAKKKTLAKIKQGAEKIKKKHDEAIKKHNDEMKKKREELDEIKAIEDEDERMAKLAEFANRRGQ